MHVYRWDLDKTYLETDFDSLRGLVRSATEPASQKRAVPGATALVRALSARDGARVFILSGSPTQMRAVLEEKLRLDGVQYDALVLKDNLDNLRKGRLRAIRGQLGYKLPTLLQSRVGVGPGVPETCFGDDAEADALVYSIYADALAGRLNPADVSRILEVAGAYPDNIDAALESLSRLPQGAVVDRIFIRLASNAPPTRFTPLGSRLVTIHSWWQAALVLGWLGQVSASVCDEVLAEARAGGAATDAWAASGLVQDLVRRGHLPPDVAPMLIGPPDLRDAVARSLVHLGPLPSALVELPPTGADYLNLVRQWGQKASPGA